ncbi:MAG: S41 family peptidase, partial [candidate division Zixibacteria bacterium]
MTLNSSFDKRALILTLFFLMVTIGIAGVMGVIVISDPAVKYSQNFAKAAKIVRDVYPDTINWQSAMLSAREAMFAQLDQFSSYIEKEQLDQFVDELSGGYHGIGISVTGDEDGLLIVSVREGGPAAREGILAGDIILAAGSINLAGKSTSEATRIIKGEENTKVKARIFRPTTSDTLDFEITRERIDFLHVPFAGMTPDSFVYIRLLDFDAGATEDLSNAVDSLVHENPLTVKGLILDLRDNPGGLFEEARKTVDLFTQKNEFIVGSSGRSRWENEEFFSERKSDLAQLPLAIIVNDGSASSAEIVAGALKYSGRAVIVGDTTFGKGLVQEYFRMQDGDGLRLTISRYF